MYLIPRNFILKKKGSEKMNSLIPRGFFDDDFDNFFFSSARGNVLKCDVYEDNDKYHIEMDAPGFSKEDIKIEVNDGRLTIVASKTKTENTEGKNYIRRERSYGETQRTFVLEDADETQIEANFKDGVLTITIPKKPESETKKIIEIS